jgi:hypothetical protein
MTAGGIGAPLVGAQGGHKGRPYILTAFQLSMVR